MGRLENHSDEFNRHLAQNGADIVVFTPNLPSGNIEQEIKYDRVRIIRYPAFEIIPNYPVPKLWNFYFWRQFISLFQADFDTVISRTRFFLTSLFALVYSKIKRVYWVHIEHGSDFVTLSSPLKSYLAKIYDKTFGKIIFISSDINVSISKAVQNFIATFDKRPSPIIYRGIDFDRINLIQPDNTIAIKYPNKIIISTVARLYKWKGIAHSIEAIRSLPKEIQSKIVFFIVGDGEDFNYLKLLTKNLPIEMLGKLPSDNALSILKKSDIYIHSSLPGGGLSTSLLEAMSCGCAIIASPNEGADEVIDGNNGILIKETSAQLIQQGIITLVSDAEKRISYGKNAKKNVLEKFLWEKSILSYTNVFKSR